MLSLVLFSAFVGGITYLTKDYRKRLRIEREIEELWEEVIKGSFDLSPKESFSIDDIKLTDSGFNCSVIFNGGSNFNTLRTLVSSLQSTFNGRVRFELDEYNNAKMYVYLYGMKIDDKEQLLFDWDHLFFKKEYARNLVGETFKIVNIEERANKGYRLYVDIPNGLSYGSLEYYSNLISNSIGKSIIKWDDEKMLAVIDIARVPVTKFNYEPYKVKPYQFYIGMDQVYNKIILDFKALPNALIGGIPTSGKTHNFIVSLMNTCLFNSRDSLRFIFNMYSTKQDFRIFKNEEHCDYYATSLENSVKSLEYLLKEHKRRNDIINKCHKYVKDIYEYEKATGIQFPVTILIIDEITNYRCTDDDNTKIKGLKNKYNSMLKQISREARNSGIYVVALTQRAGEDAVDVSLRSFLSNKVCYKQNTEGAGYTIMGDSELAKLTTKLDINKREYVYENRNGTGKGISPYITSEQIEKYLVKYQVKNKQYVIDKKLSRYEKKMLEKESKKVIKMEDAC